MSIHSADKLLKESNKKGAINGTFSEENATNPHLDTSFSEQQSEKSAINGNFSEGKNSDSDKSTSFSEPQSKKVVTNDNFSEENTISFAEQDEPSDGGLSDFQEDFPADEQKQGVINNTLLEEENNFDDGVISDLQEDFPTDDNEYSQNDFTNAGEEKAEKVISEQEYVEFPFRIKTNFAEFIRENFTTIQTVFDCVSVGQTNADFTKVLNTMRDMWNDFDKQDKQHRRKTGKGII
jgi:hypothetical protein